MPSSKIPSPARSQGAKHTPRRYKSRVSRSVGSPARSDTSVKLSAVVQMHSFVLSPMPTRRSVLTDTTDIDIPRRKSWWKKLDENSREIMDVISNKEPTEANNAIEEYIDVDILSQEKKNYTLDLPESSDGESINSIVIPQRKLFTQKESQRDNKFGQIMDNRETLAKLHKTQAVDERDLNVGRKNLFNQGKKQKSKPIFPSALLNISANKTLANKTKELPANEAKGQVKSLFGNRPGTKRKNMFADFIVSESEDEISEIQPKVFGFQKKLTQKRLHSRDGREQSPTSSITDVEMDDWRLLPSSTMVDHQIEDGLRTTPSKRARLSKLSEAVEPVNTTANKTKQSNKTANFKSRSKNASKLNEMEENQLISPTNDDELDTDTHNLNRSKNKSLSRNSKNISHEKGLKQQTSKIKEHSKSKSSSHMNTVNEDVESEAIVNNEENNFSEGNKNNKSKQNKTSSTFTKIDQALQSDDDDEHFTLEYENDDEGEEDIENNKNAVENAPQIKQKDLESTKNSSNSKNTNVSKQLQNKSKKHSFVQQDSSQTNYDQRLVMKEKEGEPHKKEKSMSSEHDKNENDQNSNNHVNVHSQLRNISHNKSLENMHNMSKNASHKTKHQEDGVGIKEIEAKKILDDDQANSDKAMNDEQNNSYSNKVDEYEEENQEYNDDNPEDSMNAEISDKDQASSRELEDILQKDPETNDDEDEQTNEVQNGEKVNDTNEDDEMIDGDENNSEENINNEDANEEMDGKNEEVEDGNEQMGDEDEETENEEIEDENEEAIVEDNQDDEAANVTDIYNNEESKEDAGDNIESQDTTDNNEEEDDEVSNGMQVTEESQENVEDREREDMQESDQNASQEVESEEEAPDDQDVSEAEDDEQEAEDSEHEAEDSEQEAEDSEHEAEDSEQEAEDSKQNVSQLDEVNVTHNSQDSDNQNEGEETEDHENENTNEDSAEEEMEHSDIENENEEEIDDDVNESRDEVDNHDESAEEDARDTAEKEQANETHDTTGRHRQHELRVPSPEAIRHDKTNAMESFTVQGRNTSVRKTKSMIRKNRSPSLAPVRESTGLSDGVRDSSGEGSGWDSHRTTRLTIRQTIGRDFTPRKSLRALVMEKSAKRHTNFTDTNADIKLPQANSTELPRHESFDADEQDGAFDEEIPSDHEESRRMRQTTLEMYLQKVKEKNIERKKQLEDEIRSSLKAPSRDMLNAFKVPAIPKRVMSRVKPQNKAKPKVKSAIPLSLIPAEVLEDMKYKPPKRYQPANASWITKRLYKFLETKLEPKYDYKARVRSEKLVETLYNFTKDIRRLAVAPPPAVDALKQEMARLNVVATHVEFYEFFHEYMPREVRVKVVPDVFNKISLPKHGVFSDILR